jgi:GNAT superfamily N-acetyltransferase
MNIKIEIASKDVFKEMIADTGWGIFQDDLPENMKIFAVSVDTHTAAYFTAKIVKIGPVTYRIIEAIYVKPEYRNRGIAEHIYTGADALEVTIERYNTHREKFHKFGFSEYTSWTSGMMLVYRPTPFAGIITKASEKMTKQTEEV